MPRFFTYFHAPLFWGTIALSLWIVSWASLHWLPSAQEEIGLVSIIALIAGWSKWHYRSPTIPEKEIPSRPETIPIGQLATQRKFFLGTIGMSARLGELDPVLGVHFNSFTPSYETKWAHLLANKTLGHYNFSFADRLVDHALSRGVRVRGHTLVWGKFDLPLNLKEIVDSSADPANTLKEILAEHIATVLDHFKGRICEWDVVNEPMDGRGSRLDYSIFFRHLGEEYLDFVFACARNADPNCRLFLNEQLWSYRNGRARFLLELLARLRARGVSVDGVGLQAHVNIPPLPQPRDLGDYLRKVAALGYDVEITEFDALLRLFSSAADPYQAQGDYFREVLKTCLDIPQCRGLTVWGLSDAESWYTTAPHYKHFGPHAPYLFNKAMQPKPTYWGFHQALSTAPLSSSALVPPATTSPHPRSISNFQPK